MKSKSHKHDRCPTCGAPVRVYRKYDPCDKEEYDESSVDKIYRAFIWFAFIISGIVAIYVLLH